MKHNTLIAGALALLPLAAVAQDTTWTVIAAEDLRVPMSPLQGNSDRFIDQLYLSHAGGDRWGFWHGSPDADRGLWSRRNGAFVRYMQFNVTSGAGPGRAEANHVFLERFTGYEDVAADGSRVFLARAGIPGDAGSQTNGVWLWRGLGNREVARAMNDSTLGPGLGAGWYIDGSSGFHQTLVLSGGAVIVDATAVGPVTQRQEVIFKHTPGTGNRPCAQSGPADVSLSPGLATGDQFSRWSSNARVRTTDAQGRVYGLFDVSGGREGIFELCNGAPRALAADEVTGPLGPGLVNPNAVFGSFYNGALVGGPGLFHFVATARETPGGSAINGIYRNNGTNNRPLALSGNTGEFSPHWAGSVFTTFNENTLDAAGQYIVFGANVNAGGQGVTGVFRGGTAGGPRPVALVGVLEYGPGQGLTWTDFYQRTVFSNGDIVMRARTSAGETALWLFQEGKPPRRIFTPNQTVALPTTGGTVQATLSSFELPASGGSAAQYASGRDGWAASDGTVLVRAYSSTYGEIWITTSLADAADFIYKDGFGG